MPEVSEYYQKHRFAKNKLSPWSNPLK
jgi:hypothetical protein